MDSVRFSPQQSHPVGKRWAICSRPDELGYGKAMRITEGIPAPLGAARVPPPGHGESEKPNFGLKIHRLAEDLAKRSSPRMRTMSPCSGIRWGARSSGP